MRFSSKNKEIPRYAKYSGENLDEFVRKHNLSISQLEKFNKKKLYGFTFMDSYQKKQKQKSLIGSDLIIGHNSESKDKIQNRVSYEIQKPRIENIIGDAHFELQKPKIFSADSQNKNFEVFQQLESMERRILNKIDDLSSDRESSQKILSLQKDIESMKERINQSNNEKERIKIEHDNVQSELLKTKKEKQQVELEYSRHTEKVIFLDFLEPYARVTSEYFAIAKSGYQRALELYEKISDTDSKNSIIVAQLILKFQLNIPLKTGNWEEILFEIKENKATSNSDLIRSFKQIPNNEEKLKEFKRILFKDVFERYASCLMILVEELSRLSKFTNSSSAIIQEIEQYYLKFSLELKNKTKAIGLDLNYVPLFENYEKYAAFTKLANQNCSLPYKGIQHMEKDTVLEIISYGFGNEETKVILA